ncbi:hypothetical protein HTV45_11800 [Streptomyces sp. CHD11]|uniref:Scr1 family TA system antitoxin-like transcriptional regulator n=1 Tax=Streptomyces sp. CHD11 TaxID=2741325 RepID=UPI001BFCA827|nr:Scr1 family TA system antitoxin-like transcriptional regulator [Streptomyces sp. CHD11]MBT3151559.1 hypothetical protein [Streptomyces sp. CHD11]
MERQQVLRRAEALPYVAYVHEAALRMPYGGAKVTRLQLNSLTAQSECDAIQVRVIPNGAGDFPGAGHALLYAEGAVPQLDTVQLDSAHGPEFTGAEAQLTKYRPHLDWMDNAALPAAASRDLIHTVARGI